MKAYTKDLEVAAGLPMKVSAKDALLRAEISREQEKEQIRQQLLYQSMEENSRASKEQKKGQKKPKNSQSAGSDSTKPTLPVTEGVTPPAPPSPWQQLVSPEGYPYYYNIITGGQ